MAACFPISLVGLPMIDSTLRITVGLNLSTDICAPHICQLCGAEVTTLGIHGLNCGSNQGQHPRHLLLHSLDSQVSLKAGAPWAIEVRWQEA